MSNQSKNETLIILIAGVVISICLLIATIYFGINSVKYIKQEAPLKAEVEQMKEQLKINETINTTMADPQSSEDNENKKKIYKVDGVKLSSGSSNFVNIMDDVVMLLRTNQIIVSKIDYQEDTAENPLQKANCSKLKLDMTIITTYPKLIKFLQEITDYEYLIEIDSLNILGNRKNIEGLIETSITLNLYVQN